MLGLVLHDLRPGDAAAIAELHAANAAADGVDVHSTVAPTPTETGVENAATSADRFWVAETRGRELVGWGSLRSWSEDDGTQVFLTDGYVAPGFRRSGAATKLLREAEDAASAAFAVGAGAGVGVAVLGGNASTMQPDRQALLLRNGYSPVFAMVEMELLAAPVDIAPDLPDGVAVRAATVTDAAELIALTRRVWAGRPYFASPTVDDFQGWLVRSDLSLFRVMTVEGRIVAFVAARHDAMRAEIEDVQVDPAFQRRGLASALLSTTLRSLAERGAEPVRLRTESHDPAGARSLYEHLGFGVVGEYRRYRKPLTGRGTRGDDAGGCRSEVVAGPETDRPPAR